MGKNYGKRLVEKSALIKQTEDYIEKEVLNPESVSAPSAPVYTPAQPEEVNRFISARPQNYEQSLRGKVTSKGIVIDIPIELYRSLRDIKDELPGESLKSLALRAVAEFVARHGK